MDKQKFLQEYEAIEEYIVKNIGWHPLTMPIYADVLYLIRLICQDHNNTANVLIPNLRVGEFSLCCDNWVGYSGKRISEHLPEIKTITKRIISQETFFEANISEKFDQIILFPIGSRNSHNEYFEKALDCLKENGVLIALTLQSFLNDEKSASIRKKILEKFSLEAVFPIKSISKATEFGCSIIVIKNTRQSPKVYMPMRAFDSERTVTSRSDELYWLDCAENAFEKYKNSEADYWIDSQLIDGRFDSDYYDPELVKFRQELRHRNCVALKEIASIISVNGLGVFSRGNRKKHGDYIFVSGKNIRENKIYFNNDDEQFCLKEDLAKNPSISKYILKQGDVVICRFGQIGQIKWAIYNGDDNFAIADQGVCIVRAKDGFERNFKTFFSTSLGAEMLEKQLRLLSFGTSILRIPLASILEILVPDAKNMEMANDLYEYKDFVAKIKALFRGCGWNIELIYVEDDSRSDLKLLFGGKLRGIVVARYIKSESIYRDNALIGQLKKCKEQYEDVPLYIYIDDGIYEFENDNFFPLLELPRPELAKAKRQVVSKNAQKEKKIERLNYNEASTADTFLMQQIIAQLAQIKEGVADIGQKLDSLSQKLSELSMKITGYQSLVERQLEYASTEQEREHIIRGFTEECIEKIKSETKDLSGKSFYNHEKEKLIETFGECAWNKMDASSQNFLITSKVTFEKYIGMVNIVDFSGVCLLVTSALETELTKRFCTNFIAFLEAKYQKDYSKFPPALLNRYSGNNPKPTNAKYFEIGSILCLFDPALPDRKYTETQQLVTQHELLDYAKKKLMTGTPEDNILPTFKNYAVTINEIRLKYRNKAAHTDALTQTDAKSCFDLVIDVTKFLKMMLDSFDE